MCDSFFELPTFESRLADAKTFFNETCKYSKIIEYECNNVDYLSYTGYILIGRSEMFSKIQSRINNLEKNYNVLFINVVVYRCFCKWLKVALRPHHGKLYKYYMNRFKCNQFV